MGNTSLFTVSSEHCTPSILNSNNTSLIMEKTVIGSGVNDLDSIVVRDHPAWPQTRPFTDRTVLEEVGGTCGNVMCILSWLGWKAMPEASLDDSPEGLNMADDLKRYGCDCRYVTNTPEGGTTLLRCTHMMDADGRKKIAFRAGSPGGRARKRRAPVRPSRREGERKRQKRRRALKPTFLSELCAPKALI